MATPGSTRRPLRSPSRRTPKPVRAAEASAARFTDAGGRGVVLRFGVFQAADSHHYETIIGAARRGVLLDVGRPDGYLPTIDADDAAAAVVRAVEDAPAGVYDVVDDEPITRRALARALARSVGRRRLHRPPGFGLAGGHGRSARRVAARLERPLPGRDRLAAAHARPGRRDRADGRRGRSRTHARARCSGIALAARGDGLGARDLRELPAPAVLRRLPLRPAVGVARRAVQRASGARLRCDEPRARDRHARRAVLRVAGRGARGCGGLARVLGAARDLPLPAPGPLRDGRPDRQCRVALARHRPRGRGAGAHRRPASARRPLVQWYR